MEVKGNLYGSQNDLEKNKVRGYIFQFQNSPPVNSYENSAKGYTYRSVHCNRESRNKPLHL